MYVAVWFKTMARVTPERLSACATEAAQAVLKKINELLKIQLPKDLLSCKFVGAEDEEAPINSQARGLFEWRIDGMGSVKVSALCRAVVHDKALKPTKDLKRALEAACIPACIHAHPIPAMKDVEKEALNVRAVAVAKRDVI